MNPKVGIFSNPNGLSIALFKNLSKRGLNVAVIGQKREWKEALDGIGEEAEVVSPSDSSLGLDYLFFLSGFSGEPVANIKNDIGEVGDFLERNKAKSLFVFPVEKKSHVAEATSDIPHKTLYLGDLFGPRMDFISTSIVGTIFYQIADEEKVSLPAKDFDFLYLYIPDAVEEIVRTLFSYGFSPKEKIIAQKSSLYRFLGEIGKASPEIIFLPDSRKVDAGDISDIKFSGPRQTDDKAIKETISWLAANRLSIMGDAHEKLKREKLQTKKLVPDIPKKSALKKTFKFSRRVIFTCVLLFLIILCVPYLSLLVSFSFLKLSVDSYLSGNEKVGNILISASDYVSVVGFNSSNVAVKVPVLGRVYVIAADGSILVREALVVGKRSIDTLKDFKSLAAGIVGEKDYDLVTLSSRISTNSELIYQDLSFLQSEIDRMPGLSDQLKKRGISSADYRKLFLFGSEIAKSLPDMLGSNKPKTYLVLFQNNMELRPTGGFIGSFALVTFDGGKLADVEFFDVYTADGQLKGHVEPPNPIKDHLGEANWYLRDSNWDPDFRISAQRAEWFLDKELERGVDGVVGIDVDVVRDLLRVLGPLDVGDVGVKVDYKNVYEKLQYEVENNFFPGSQKKANLLTGLGKAILEKVKSSVNPNYEELGKVAYSNLKSRHIQVFVHNSAAEKAFSGLNFGGEVTVPRCSTTNCASLLVGLTEANVGVNKVNYFITRTISFSSFVSQGTLENTLIVELSNNAPQALGISGRYKNYIRLITNGGIKVKSVGIIEAGGVKAVNPDIREVSGRTEAGVLVDIPAGTKKSVRFSFSYPTKLTFGSPGQIKYFIRKQAGTGNDPISVKIVPPSGVAFGSPTIYNTHLAGDLIIEPSW